MTKSTETRRVGSSKKSEKGNEPKEKKERKPRPDFVLATATDTNDKIIKLNEDKELTAVPTNWTAEFALLKRKNFNHRALHLEWKAAVVDAQIVSLMSRRDEFVGAAEEARSGKPSKKRQTAKLEKLRKQIAELEAMLGSEGVDTE